MADSKTKRSGADRRRAAVGQGYEVNYFARKHGMSAGEAHQLIDKIGNDRAKLNEAATALKRGR